MEILPSLLAFIDNTVRVAKRNVSDAVTDTENWASITNERLQKTIDEYIKDPGNFIDNSGPKGAIAAIFQGAKSKLWNKALYEKALKLQEKGFPESEINKETGTWLTTPEKMPKSELSTAHVKFKDNAFMDTNSGARMNVNDTLLDTIHFPELGIAYPELNDISLAAVLNPKVPAGKGTGKYYEGRKLMEAEAGNMEELLSILIHETDHAVQGVEGFARGGMPGTHSLVTGGNAHRDRIFKDLQATRPDLSEANLHKKADYIAYLSQAGEASARAAQARQKLTEEQLRARHPVLDYDMDPASLLVYQP